MPHVTAIQTPSATSSPTAFCGALTTLARLEMIEKDAAERQSTQLGRLRQHLANQQWSDAAGILRKPSHGDPESFIRRVHRHFAANLAELTNARPALAERLISHAACSRCALVAAPSGAPTIAQQPPGGKLDALTPGGEPGPALARYAQGVQPQVNEGRSFALCGVGDGYLLSWLAANPPDLPLEREHCVHLIEPHPEVLLHILMLHDLTGDAGPIRQQRFQWWIGPDWKKQIKSGLRNDCFIPYPEQFIRYSILQSQIEKQIDRMANEFMRWEEEMVDALRSRYAAIEHSEWVDVLGPEPSRPPRAMLITSRFSTVLQYSTRDVEEALRDIGWETQLVIEPESHHQITTRALLKTMVDFRPDLIFQIDHLRYERAKLYPPEIPFVCWIQDDLPNLMSEEASAGIGLRDYVLTCAHNTYVEKWNYPARQCIYVDKLTRVPDRPATWKNDGPPDLAFVSNASQNPEELVDSIADDFADPPEMRTIVESSCHAMINVYERGGSLMGLPAIRSIVLQETDRRGGQWTSMEYCNTVAMRLASHLNNALYRQQALEWAASIAERHDLSLHLYGQGWEDHPRFAKYAKGYIKYGRDLEELTRRARINLQIVPYSCLHQRLLDGLVAGGFFLVRANAIDQITEEIGRFARAMVARGMTTIDEALDELDGNGRQKIAQMLDRHMNLLDTTHDDPIARHREFAPDVQEFISMLPPCYDNVSFNDQAELEERVLRYINEPTVRMRIQMSMREWVEQHFTYRVGLSRITGQIGRLIRTESDVDPPDLERTGSIVGNRAPLRDGA